MYLGGMIPDGSKVIVNEAAGIPEMDLKEWQMKQGCIAGFKDDTSRTHRGQAFLYYFFSIQELAYEIFR